MKVNVALIVGDCLTVIGVGMVAISYYKNKYEEVIIGTVLAMLGVFCLLYVIITQKSKNKKLFSIINSIYALLGIIFAIIAWTSKEKMLISALATTVLFVAAVTLNLSNFLDEKLN
jgi:membrane protease YdiL (CAAX protease family)